MSVTDHWFVTRQDGETGTILLDPSSDASSTTLDARCPECGEPLRIGSLDVEPPVPFTNSKNNCDLRGFAFG